MDKCQRAKSLLERVVLTEYYLLLRVKTFIFDDFFAWNLSKSCGRSEEHLWNIVTRTFRYNFNMQDVSRVEDPAVRISRPPQTPDVGYCVFPSSDADAVHVYFSKRFSG